LDIKKELTLSFKYDLDINIQNPREGAKNSHSRQW
jgi:hypothetical protein